MSRILCERRIYHAGRMYFTDCFGTTETAATMIIGGKTGREDTVAHCGGRRRRHEGLTAARSWEVKRAGSPVPLCSLSETTAE
eukprot:scaffold12456_cov131-Isochrysis_galbana.AAC.1